MRFFIKWAVNESITSAEAGWQRDSMEKQLRQVHDAGKVVMGGHFGDTRGGFMVLEVGEAFELLNMLAPGIIENCTVECHPIFGFDELFGLFERLAKEEVITTSEQNSSTTTFRPTVIDREADTTILGELTMAVGHPTP